MRRIVPGAAWTRWLASVLVVTGCSLVAEPTTTTAAEPTTTPTTANTVSTTTTTVATTTTAPREAAPPGALLVLGDWGSGTLPQGAVAGAMARYAEGNRVAAVLTTGDNFYSDDAEFLLEPMDWVFQGNIQLWITWGNHDVESTARIEAVEEAFGSPPRWTVHEWGGVDVVILDSNQVASEEQIDFLDEALEQSDNPAIVVFHHPPRSCSLYGDTLSVLQNWVPLFDEDVVMVLGGHDHNYQRFEVEGVAYVVSGGGGRSLYELTECPAGHPERVAGEAVHHFLVLTQGDEAISVEVMNVTSETVDSFAVPLP